VNEKKIKEEYKANNFNNKATEVWFFSPPKSSLGVCGMPKTLLKRRPAGLILALGDKIAIDDLQSSLPYTKHTYAEKQVRSSPMLPVRHFWFTRSWNNSPYSRDIFISLNLAEGFRVFHT
jgi:hypothetical protein